MLQLDRYFFTISQVVSNPDFSAEDGGDTQERAFNVAASAKCSDEKDCKKLFIAVSLNNDIDDETLVFTNETAYCVNIQAIGHFSINKEDDNKIDEGKVSKYAYNAAQLLVGSIRDHIFTITSKSPWGPYYLPAIYLSPESLVIEND